ncbi:MAG: cold-shock protein [Phycisphaerae bacterium]
MRGTIKWFDHTKKFGFIQPSDGGKDVFVHYSAVEPDSTAKLRDGASVEFEVTEGGKGPQASGVSVLD